MVTFNSNTNEFIFNGVSYAPIFETKNGTFVASAINDKTIDEGWRHTIIIGTESKDEILNLIQYDIDHPYLPNGKHSFDILSRAMCLRELLQKNAIIDGNFDTYED